MGRDGQGNTPWNARPRGKGGEGSVTLELLLPCSYTRFVDSAGISTEEGAAKRAQGHRVIALISDKDVDERRNDAVRNTHKACEPAAQRLRTVILKEDKGPCRRSSQGATDSCTVK